MFLKRFLKRSTQTTPDAALYDDLRWRGLVFQESSGEGIRSLLASPPRAAYIGFDPTAESLHIGNLLGLVTLARFQRAGHRPLAIVGGGTGLIGDPSGRTAERTLNEKATVDRWMKTIRRQIERVLDTTDTARGARILNNDDWIGSLSAIDYLREIGKHFTVNWMIGKESVHGRLEGAQEGISYTEFSYMILQAYDFLHVAEEEDCFLQLGGSDQWGNIVAGIELIRKKLGKEAFGMTFPLITTASGKKFGKTEAGAIWLDPQKTSPYDFYQFWFNVDDKDVIAFLKYFTFLSRDEIGALEQNTAAHPEERAAQRRLAEEVTRLVHGGAGLTQATEGSSIHGNIDGAPLETLVGNAPTFLFATLEDVPKLPQLLVNTTLSGSATQARQTIAEGGVYVNNARVTDPEFRPTKEDLLDGKFLIIGRGKKKRVVVKIGG